MSRATKRAAPVPGVVVYRRGQRWAYRLELERDPLTGDRRWEYKSGFNTDEEAWTSAVKAKAERATGQRVAPSRQTVADFLAEWLTAVKDTLKPSTYANYTDYSNSYVLPFVGKRKLQALDVPTLNALYRHLSSQGRRKADSNGAMYKYWSAGKDAGREPTPIQIVQHCKVSIHAARSAVRRYRRGRVPAAWSPGLAAKTVKNVHRMLHRALNDAAAWRYISFNPAVHASLPRESRKDRRKRGATWTPEQLMVWLKVATRDRDAGVWVLAATTGMRRSELAGAERDLLDLDNAELKVTDTRVVVSGHAQESDGKTDSGWRTISLDPVTVAYLRLHLGMLDRERVAFGAAYHDSGHLVCHPDGRPVHPETITDRFNRLVDLAGVPRIRLHDVRHTYATMSLDNGVDPKIVADRIGHANMAYTLSIYTHPSTGLDRPAAERVAGVIFGEGWETPVPDDA